MIKMAKTVERAKTIYEIKTTWQLKLANREKGLQRVQTSEFAHTIKVTKTAQKSVKMCNSNIQNKSPNTRNRLNMTKIAQEAERIKRKLDFL